jgi:copper chaperone NosL
VKYLALAALVILTACKEDIAEAPAAVPLNEESLSYFCQMNIAEHGGPKGQVFLAGHPLPLFFAQVRDLVAYIKSPERDADITAVYVSDMGAALSWDQPGANNWIPAEAAIFVIDAGVAGGMGAPEIVPFAEQNATDDFIARFGGSAMSFDQIPDAAAIGPVDLDLSLETPA